MMLYKSATLKSACESLDKVLPESLKSYAQIDLITANSHIVLVSLMFDRRPEDIAKRFLTYRLQKPKE